MRKTFLLLLCLGVVGAFTAGPATASHTPPTHSDNQRYESGTPGAGDLVGFGFCLEETGPEPQPDVPLDSCGVHSTPAEGDWFVDITITDDNNNPIYATVGQDLDGNGAIDTAFADFCGSIKDYAIMQFTGDPGDVIVFPWTGPGTIGGVCSPVSTPAWGGPATSGTVTFQYYGW